MIDYLTANRDHWNQDAPNWAASGARLWAAEAPVWGIFNLPDTELEMLPADMRGMAAIELGCGTGYVSGWMARRGAAVTAVDVSRAQLETARRLAAEHGAGIDFVECPAERVDRPDASFDFAISEYGAAIWSDPELWIAEAARLLKPGGRLVWLGTHPLAILCTPMNGAPCEAALHRSYDALNMVDWRDVEIDPGGVEFARSIEDWLRLFRDTGFEVEDYRELRAPATAEGRMFSIPADWAKRFPAEQVWKLVRR